MVVGLQSRLEPSGDEIAAKVIDGEAIIINLTSGMYYSLNGAGAAVWENLAKGLSVGNAALAVARLYEAAPDQVQEDTTRLASEFVAEGLMRVLPNASLSTASPATGGVPPAGDLPYTTPQLQKYADMADLLALDPPMPSLAKSPWAEAEGGA